MFSLNTGQKFPFFLMNYECWVPRKPGTGLTQYLWLFPPFLIVPTTLNHSKLGLSLPSPTIKFLNNSASLVECGHGSSLSSVLGLLFFSPSPGPPLLSLLSSLILPFSLSSHGPTYSVSCLQSGFFQMLLTMFSLIATMKPFSLTSEQPCLHSPQ